MISHRFKVIIIIQENIKLSSPRGLRKSTYRTAGSCFMLHLGGLEKRGKEIRYSGSLNDYIENNEKNDYIKINC